MKSPSQLSFSSFDSAARLDNFRITAEGKLEKRGGSRLVYTFPAPVRGVCSAPQTETVEDNDELLYVVAGDKLYSLTEADGRFSAAVLAELNSDSGAIELFRFAGMLYILDGVDYYRWDGSSLVVPDGYVPLVRRYAGAVDYGKENERVNLLTDRVRMRFSPDGENKRFRLWGRVKSIDGMIVNGTRISDYTTEIGTFYSYVNTDALYAKNPDDIIEVEYTLNQASRRSRVTSCTHAAVYGGDTDSRVFLYGGENASVIYPSEPENGDNGSRLSGEYFPDGGEIKVGDGNLSVTGAVRQFDRLAIFTEEGAFYTYPSESVKMCDIQRFSFLILPLNSDVGASRSGGAVLVENEPYAMSANGLYRFKSTSVRDERLAIRIEAPDFIGLNRDFGSACRLYVNKLRGELWCYGGVGAKIAIYNARLGKWYCFSGIEPDRVFSYMGEAAYSVGAKVYVFDESRHDDSGVPFTASCESGCLDLGNAFKSKTLYGFGVSVSRIKGSSVGCVLTSDKGDVLDFKFNCDSDGDMPIVYKTHARLGKVDHVSYKLTAGADSKPMTVNGVMFYFR